MKGTIANEADFGLDIVWGARAIGKAINRNERVAYGLLESGQIPGARKLGGRWCVTAQKLREFFEQEVA